MFREAKIVMTLVLCNIMMFVDQQGGLPSGPSSSGGPSFNQTPHQYPFLPGQQPAQGSGGNATGLSYSVPWSNATVPWKKQQVDIKNIAKGTMNKLTGSMKNKQGASLYKPSAYFACFSFLLLWMG